jgi:hypothetical protein
LQEKVCPSISKDYMDYKNPFVKDVMTTLETVIKVLNRLYFPGTNQGVLRGTSPMRNEDGGLTASSEQPFALITEQLAPLSAPIGSIDPPA